MNFGGIQLLTTLDYPDHIATTLFVNGCNMKCPFCHNSTMVMGKTMHYSEDDVFHKIMQRKDKIDHIVITGGEPTIYGYKLIGFISKLKKNGFYVKLDTNGLHPMVIKSLLSNHLLDYIAMDIKTILDEKEYSKISGIEMTSDKIDTLKESIELIKESEIDYEFRTTVNKTLHSKEVLIELAKDQFTPHYIQQFVKSENVFDQELIPYAPEELKEIVKEMQSINENIHLRGI